MTLAGSGTKGPDPMVANREIVDQLLEHVRKGVPLHIAADLMRIDRTTMTKSLQRGGHPRAHASSNYVPPDEAREPYKSFVQDVLAAEAEAQASLVDTVRQTAREDGEFALKVLRHRWPEEWSPSRIRPAPVVEVSTEAPPGKVVIVIPDNERGFTPLGGEAPGPDYLTKPLRAPESPPIDKPPEPVDPALKRIRERYHDPSIDAAQPGWVYFTRFNGIQDRQWDEESYAILAKELPDGQD